MSQAEMVRQSAAVRIAEQNSFKEAAQNLEQAQALLMAALARVEALEKMQRDRIEAARKSAAAAAVPATVDHLKSLFAALKSTLADRDQVVQLSSQVSRLRLMLAVVVVAQLAATLVLRFG